MANPARSFDSLAYSNKLRKAGISEEQANIQAEALLTVIQDQLLSRQDLEKVELKLSNDIEKLDTKLSSDIERLDVKLSADIKEVKVDVERVEAKLSHVEAKLSADIEKSELRLFVRLIGAMVLVGGILKYLPAIHF